MKTFLEELASYVESLSFDDLPKEVVSKANDALYDLVGCYLAALKEESNRKFLSSMMRNEGKPEATLWGTGERTSAADASLVHGALGYDLEFDDGVSLGGHWGSASIPSVIAAAEKYGRSGRDVVLGIVAAYEVGTRISRLFAAGLLKRKIHFPCAMGPFAAAAGAGKAMGLDAETLAKGLALCCIGPVGPYGTAVSGAKGKDLYSGWPAFLGIRMLELASAGFGGDVDTFESENGFAAAVAGKPLALEEKAKALGTLGKDFCLMQSYFKPYPCCRWLHAPLRSLEILLSRNAGKTAEGLTVYAPAFMSLYDAKTGFDKKVACQYSAPYVLAAMIVAGKLGLEEFDPAFSGREDVRVLAGRVNTAKDPELDSQFPTIFETRLEILFSDGTTDRETGRLPWSPEFPAAREELVRKFYGLTRGILTYEQRERWNEQYRNGIENVDHVGTMLLFLKERLY